MRISDWSSDVCSSDLDDRPPVLCLHGLTRNARDFAGLAQHLAGEWRVIVPETRGRGESEYARDSSTYVPATYVDDRSEERRVGKDLFGTCLFCVSPFP